MPTPVPRREPAGHQTVDRLLSEDELEALLVWWRTTAKDKQGMALFCRHFEHTGACRICPPPLDRRPDE